MELSANKIIVSSGLVVLLGLLITIFSIYHSMHMGGAFIQYPLFLYGATILSLVVGGFVVYLFQERFSKSANGKILSILPNDERKVLKILFDRKEIEQKRLTTLSGLSPVKISRVISTLEQRGVVEKKKQGYTNLVILQL